MNPQHYLVILFHGIGGSGAQLMPLASSRGSTLPNARFAASDAPFSHPYGHQWFNLDGGQLRPDRIQVV
jgi:phospholipase/carboxylesterase